jgi:hypothetical protein
MSSNEDCASVTCKSSSFMIIIGILLLMIACLSDRVRDETLIQVSVVDQTDCPFFYGDCKKLYYINEVYQDTSNGDVCNIQDRRYLNETHANEIVNTYTIGNQTPLYIYDGGGCSHYSNGGVQCSIVIILSGFILLIISCLVECFNNCRSIFSNRKGKYSPVKVIELPNI